MPSPSFHPVIAEWFSTRFQNPTEPQRLGWPAIRERRDTLIAAPTGSGKTLTAFLASLDRLLRLALAGELRDQTYVVYVSPLRALSNDIQRNLQGPLAEILRTGPPRTSGLSGDPRRWSAPATRRPDERQQMVRRPPHILVTTPESLYLVLTGSKSREILRHVETVIVDEIHAVARDKRGSHLALSLERLDALCHEAARPHRPVGDAEAARRAGPVPGRRDGSAARHRGRRPLPRHWTWPSKCRGWSCRPSARTSTGPRSTNGWWS